MRQLTAPMPLASPFRKDTVTTALVFEEDTRCHLSYRSDANIDYLPIYLNHLKLSRTSRRPQY